MFQTTTKTKTRGKTMNNNTELYFVGSYEDGFGMYSTLVKDSNGFHRVKNDNELMKILNVNGISVNAFINEQCDCRDAIIASSRVGKINLMCKMDGRGLWNVATKEILEIAGL